MGNNQAYTCPDCGAGGAHPRDLPAPLCHKCDYKIKMKPSHNGKILEECDHEGTTYTDMATFDIRCAKCGKEW